MIPVYLGHQSQRDLHVSKKKRTRYAIFFVLYIRFDSRSRSVDETVCLRYRIRMEWNRLRPLDRTARPWAGTGANTTKPRVLGKNGLAFCPPRGKGRLEGRRRW